MHPPTSFWLFKCCWVGDSMKWIGTIAMAEGGLTLSSHAIFQFQLPTNTKQYQNIRTQAFVANIAIVTIKIVWVELPLSI